MAMLPYVVDWSATGAMIGGLGSVASAIAVVWAALKAANTFRAWKHQKVTEKKMEHAERILVAAYKNVYALDSVRGRMLWAAELESAEDKLKENPGFVQSDGARRKLIVSAQVYYTNSSMN